MKFLERIADFIDNPYGELLGIGLGILLLLAVMFICAGTLLDYLFVICPKARDTLCRPASYSLISEELYFLICGSYDTIEDFKTMELKSEEKKEILGKYFEKRVWLHIFLLISLVVLVSSLTMGCGLNLAQLFGEVVDIIKN